MVDLQKNIDDLDLIFLDLETTGLDVTQGEAICEIGAYKVRNKEVTDTFHSLVNPKKSVPKEAFDIHKIGDEELKDAPVFEQVIEKLQEFIRDNIICVYNAKFDMGFLNYEARKAGYDEFCVPVIDILVMARRMLRLPKYNLGSLCQFFNIECKEAPHRALADAYVAKEVFFKLRDILRENQIDLAAAFISLYGFDNAVFREQENNKIKIIRDAADSKKEIKIRWLACGMQVQQAQVASSSLLQDDGVSYMLCRNAQGQSQKIKLSDILGVELA